MSAFSYRAVGPDGRVTRGQASGDDADAVTAALEQQGLVLLALRHRPRGFTTRGISRARMAILFRNLAALTGAGVPVERAVASSCALTDGRLLRVVAQARVRLREGQPLSRALGDGAGDIPPIVLGMLRGGERIGHVPGALNQIADHLEREARLIADVRQALAYPIVLLAVGSVAMVVLLTRVIPRFAVLIADSGTRAPASTRLLITIAAAIQSRQLVLIGCLAGIGVIAVLLYRTPRVRAFASTACDHLPFIGPLASSLASARICTVLAGMLQAGGAVLPALDAATDAAGNERARKALGEAARRVREGSTLARSLRESGAVSSTAVQLISIGEESGQVPAMAQRAADLSAMQVKRGLDTIVTMIEPALILLFGSLVAFVAAALLQAVYGLQPGTMT